MQNKLRDRVDIKPGDNLNKENFWNAASEIYPTATKMFCVWIDKYKAIAHPVSEYNRPMTWDAFFGNIWPTAQPIKFHHIPIEMQVGIIYRFFYETTSIPEYEIIGTASKNYLSAEGWVYTICDMLMILELAATSNEISAIPLCPNCHEPNGIISGNTMCNKCVAELHDENK